MNSFSVFCFRSHCWKQKNENRKTEIVRGERFGLSVFLFIFLHPESKRKTRTENIFQFSLSRSPFNRNWKTKQKKNNSSTSVEKLKAEKWNGNCFLCTFFRFCQNEERKTENILLVPVSAFRLIVRFASFFSRKTEKEEKTKIGRQG